MTNGADTLEARCRALLSELELVRGEGIVEIVPLSGGVASDIARIVLDGSVCCVKFALPKLKVAEDWRAPVHRNRAEYAWLQVAARVSPANAPRLLGRSETLHGFAMEYLDGPEVSLWKAALLAGRRPNGEARRVADLLGRIHRHSASSGFDRREFGNRDDFEALRIDPYLRFTATRHPDVAIPLRRVADQLFDAERVLVHGDVSPKNILFRRGEPFLLDAECATMGDASFDVGFCLNHLLLKSAHVPGMRVTFRDEALEFWRIYRAHVDWEDPVALDRRVAILLPMLMLARVDGKSPVEYLSDAARRQVRATALMMIKTPPMQVQDVISQVTNQFEDQNP